MMYKIIFMLLFISPLAYSKAVPTETQKDHHWTYLILAQFWPASSCIYFEERGDSCKIPSDIHGWTIHGLWPSRPNSEEPNYCNSSMRFDYDKIKSLQPQLDKNWHFYRSDVAADYLWEHEWVKHGTCAYSLPALQGELKYFSQALKLHSHVNVTQALSKAGIVPSKSDTYKAEDFNNAISKYFNVKPVIVCDYDKENKKTYVDQIYLCYDKSFQLQDCYEPSLQSKSLYKQGMPTFYSNCQEQDDIYYIPFNKNSTQPNKSLIFRSEKGEH